MKNIDKVMELMANYVPLSKALEKVYETRKVKIPVNENCLSIPIKKLKFNNRASNCFEKLHLETFGQVIDYLNENHWNSIDNFGKGTAKDVFEKLLDAAWSKLSRRECAEFLLRVDKDNKARED